MRATPVLLALLVTAPAFAGCLDAMALRKEETRADPVEPLYEPLPPVSGYLEMADGIRLAYTLVLPDGEGPWPTLLHYSAYAPGSKLPARYVDRFVPKGYALLGVNARGTGCSGGVFDLFSPTEAADGAAAVEWAADEKWSNGKVGMIGKSYPGISQWFVAKERPPHLVAIAPGHFFGDLYRDVGYPGGIPNVGFGASWSLGAQPTLSAQATVTRAGTGDADCLVHGLDHARNVETNAFVVMQDHPFDDELFRERSPESYISDVDVPAFMVHAFQDEQVGVRGIRLASMLRAPSKLVLSNGDHEVYHAPAVMEALERWFDYWLKGRNTGIMDEPRVAVWFDAAVGDAGLTPGWALSSDSWPLAAPIPLQLYFHEDGRLLPMPPTEEKDGNDIYLYPGASPTTSARTLQDHPEVDPYAVPPAPGTFVAYTSDPFPRDVIVQGPVRVTVHLSSSASDTDIQVTLLEVRPNGDIVHVQRGWLRASHRELDELRSSLYRPWHPHDDARPLGSESNAYQIEVPEVAHAFRAGSSLRIEVGSPAVIPEYWSFALVPEAAINVVHYDRERPSHVTLPTLARAVVIPAAPECGAALHQPCRPTSGETGRAALTPLEIRAGSLV